MGHEESEWEADARDIVAAELGVPVIHQDVGGKGATNATPDALIDPDGEQIQMEVVRDLDPHYAAMQGNLDKHGYHIPAQNGEGWLVTVSRTANVKALHAQLEQLLAANSAETENPYTSVPEPLARLGVLAAWRFPGTYIHITTLRAASWDRDIPPLNTWVEQTLTANQDVQCKLRARGGGHAFIWASATSPMYLHSLIAGIDGSLPAGGPSLPGAIHRLWVAGFDRTRAIWTEGDRWHRSPANPQ